MASLVLLLSELVRHHEPDFAFAAQQPSTTTSSPPPPPLSCGASMSCSANKSLRNDARMYEWESVEEDPQEQRVCVDVALML
ncbi:hypothetical protein V6N13_043226 [Hibiscus sabdariffa]|uniref:Uncharacterized protein n=1 Tax=Hibiscus sabdariffa TaxID=183260 RepID=A0ABR2G3B7_9ROSI